MSTAESYVGGINDIEPDEPVRLPKKKNTDDEMDITPMIDITFLLLIFFLVASKINAEAAVELPSAINGTAVPTKTCVTIIVRRGTGEVAEVLRGKDSTPFSKDVDLQEVELADYVREAFDGGKTEVMIKAEGEARTGEVDRVKKAISEALEEGQKINVAILQSS